MKLYLSGPMTGMPDFNYPAFEAAATTLRGAGHEVVSPHECAALEEKLSWIDCMRRDIVAMMTCDAIALLAGFEQSRGATIELQLARALEFQVFYVRDGALCKTRYVSGVDGHSGDEE